MPILLAKPVPHVIEEAIQAWQAFGVIWHGCDGSVWDMVDPTSGVVLTPDGTRGLGMPTFDRWTTSSPALPGSRYQGSRTQERTWMWPIFIYSSTDSLDYLAKESAFWASVRPDVKGTIELKHPTGKSRFLDLRFVDDSGVTFGMDPSQNGWAVYAVNMVADDQPYWYSNTITRTFQAPSDVDFFESSGGVFFISPGGTTDDASIPNPGDVNAWCIWTVTGSHGGCVLSVGGGSLTLPAMADGVTWTIDTRPDQMTAVDQDGADQSADITWNPAPVPPGEEVTLTIDLTSPDDEVSVRCELTPLHFRAF